MGFRLYAFGGLRLESDDKVVRGPPAQRRRLALLSLLATSDQRKLHREKAIGYLWPERSTTQARHLLSESLYVLRRLMGEDVIVSVQDALVLNPEVLWSDVVAFVDAVVKGAREDAVGLYRGPFLDGFYLKDAPEFGPWVESVRDRFSRQLARMLESLAETAAASGNVVPAAEWWSRLASHDPYSSRIAGRYMEALASAGERAQAIRFAATHVARLRDLGLEPDPGFQATLSRLRQSASPGSIVAATGRAPDPEGAGEPTATQSQVMARQDIDVSTVGPDAPSPGSRAQADRDTSPYVLPGAVHADAEAPSPGRAPARRAVPARTHAAVLALALVMTAVLFAARYGRRDAHTPILGTVTTVTFEPGVEIEPNFSPDGRFVAYAGGTPSRIYLRQQGSRPVLLVTPDSGPAQHRPRWSPDGSRIAFDAHHSIFLIPALGGVPLEIVAEGWSPTWAPDGQRIAYALGDTIFTTHVDGGRPRRLAVVIQPAELAWSPDGRWIAATSGNDAWDGFVHIGNLAQSRIVLISTEDGHLVEVTGRAAMNVAPTWAPDGRYLLFISNRSGTRDIYAVRLASDGRLIGEPERMSTGLEAHSMAISPHGDRLLYALYQARVNIWSLRIPDGGPVGVDSAVALTTGTQMTESISVSPDRRWLYFTSDRAGSSDIWRMPLPGGEPAQVTADPSDDFGPEQSPDGKWLAFFSIRDGTRDIWVMPTGPGNPVRLTDSPEDEHDAHWSPDGLQLCYSHHTGAGGSLELLRRHGDTWSKPIVPPDSDGRPNGLLGCAGWLPDGRHMVVQDAGHTMIGLMEPDGGALETIYRADPGQGRPQPLWVRVDPRTGTIYFRDWTSIWTLETGSSAPREIVHFDDPSRRSTRIEMDVDGEHVYFSLGDPQSDLWVAELSL